MFLKVKVQGKDRNAKPFLWRGSDIHIEPQEYIIASVLFGAKSSPFTALFVKTFFKIKTR